MDLLHPTPVKPPTAEMAQVPYRCLLVGLMTEMVCERLERESGGRSGCVLGGCWAPPLPGPAARGAAGGL